MIMHPAPSLAESFPKSTKTDERSQQHVYETPQQPRLAHAATHLGHPEPLKIENHSDYSVTYSVESSQSIFSVKDGSEISSNRRASRRRTGPLSAAQREKAALIRKLGACHDCRRRRVACHPNHHNMSWEEAVQKYRSSSPLQELATLAGRPISPALSQMRPPPPPYAQNSQEMDLDPAPGTPNPQSIPGRVSPNETRLSRTPLPSVPSGPRIDRHVSIPSPLAASHAPYSAPHAGSVKHDLENVASTVLSSPFRSRYSSVYALLIYWQDEHEPNIAGAVQELSDVFQKCYHYVPEIVKIPAAARDGYSNPWRWLSRKINEFIDKSDTRDTLKIVYYNGHSYLDDNREMVLSSSRNREKAGTIRWTGIQHILEEATSDTLILMDSTYYPASKMVRRRGVLELIAASTPEDYYLERGIFTRVLTDQLRQRAAHRSPNMLSAAELHSKLLSLFPKLILDSYQEKGAAAAFPAPLHMQTSGNARLPSIMLAPLPLQILKPHSNSDNTHPSPQITLSFRLTEEPFGLESWTEWLRMMPEGIRDVKVDAPYTFR
ncbi:putative tyrosine-protein phosphatase non-receptor type 6 [Rosellinia necatrix]|uniref:Putative tyrosine-protein phosphatase non-receptor type 6 n=1 Tax=Rosellinia necatrix TaxID=77044 RepID=A0A1W2TKB7_ROSNE|nr:putative tyrosine-protein phosphatase non-receptor type 6 [Rosellinia necatrix]